MRAKIFWVNGASRNYGDIALVRSMEKLLREYSRYDLAFETIDLKSPKPIDAKLVERINAEGDMLLVGGGGLFMRGDGFYTRSGWQFNISRTDLDMLNVPLVCWSLGYNVFPGDRQGLGHGAWQHIQTTYEMADLFSVRDLGTADELRNRGIGPVEIVPDPAVLCKGLPMILYVDQSLPIIGVNWAGDRTGIRHVSNDPTFAMSWLCQAIKRYFADYGGGVVVPLPHVSLYDQEPWKALTTLLGEKYVYPVFEEHPELMPESERGFETLLNLYGSVNQTVGMRGHANILSLAALTPYTAYGEHQKNRYFVEDTNGVLCIPGKDDLVSALHANSYPNCEDRIVEMSNLTLVMERVLVDFTKRVVALLG